VKKLPALAVTMLVVLSGQSAHAHAPIAISTDGLSRERITVPLGGSIAWTNGLDHDVSIVSGPLAYWGVDVPTGATAETTMTLAGFWDYWLVDDPSVTGRVRILPQISDTTPQVGQWITFTVASDIIKPGYEWDLLRKKVGTGYLGTVAGGVRSKSVQLRFHQTGEFVFAMRTFGYNPTVGYDTYTPISPRIKVTVTE
jgi:hypothetical protein